MRECKNMGKEEEAGFHTGFHSECGGWGEFLGGNMYVGIFNCKHAKFQIWC